MAQGARELRFGVIGCGKMAEQVHCPNLAAIPGARTVAYADLEIGRAEALLKKHGGEYVTTDARRIFGDRSVDGVLIQTGPAAHPKLVQGAARAGKHVFVEKPIAIELGDALETVRAVRASGVKFLHGVCNRLAPMVRIAKRMCPRPHYSFCQCSHTVTHQACHNIDLAVNLFHEAALRRVYAGGGRYWGLDAHLPADSFAAVLTFADGSTHNYLQHGNAFNPLLTKYHFQLFGADCCVYLAKRFKECHYMTGAGAPERSWIFDGSDADRGPFGYMGHYDELKEWVTCIREGGTPTMTVRDAAFILAVEKAILRSVETGQALDFPAFLREHKAEFLEERG